MRKITHSENNEQCTKWGAKQPFQASFSLFLSFQYTVESIQIFDINKFLAMTGFEPQTSGIRSDRSTN